MQPTCTFGIRCVISKTNHTDKIIYGCILQVAGPGSRSEGYLEAEPVGGSSPSTADRGDSRRRQLDALLGEDEGSDLG